MQKIAQKRSVLNKLREMTNVSGIAAEKFFNPKFKEVMEHLRAVDDQIRTFVVGKKLGDAQEDAGGPALKDSLKQAKSNFNRREYLLCVSNLSFFHDQVTKITIQLKNLDSKVDEVHHEFLFDKLDPEHKEQLRSLKTKFAQEDALFYKQAGVMDFFHNIGTSRGRALAAWEKRYPNEVNKFKNGLTTLLQKSDGLLSTIIDSLKDMASARSVRNIDDYMKGSAKILKAVQNYETGKGGFKEFYKNVLEPYLEKMEAYTSIREMPTPSQNPSAQELKEKDIPIGRTSPHTDEVAVVAPSAVPPEVDPSPTAAQISAIDKDLITEIPAAAPAISHAPRVPAVDPVLVTLPSGHTALRPARVPSFPTATSETPTALIPPPVVDQADTDRAPPLFEEEGVKKAPVHRPTMPGVAPPPIQSRHTIPMGSTGSNFNKSHSKFYQQLQALSGENPAMLSLFIKKYAAKIENTDPSTSSKLFKICQRIKG